MKFTYLAICSNTQLFWSEQITDLNFTKNYPGSSWLPIFSSICKKELGIKIISGYNALEKKINPEEILVIQEMNSWHGIKLIKKGAFPFLILSGESMLYAVYYYDFFRYISKPFKYKLTFFDKKYLTSKKIHHYYFPSFFAKKLKKNNIKWEDRNFSVLIAANKSSKPNFPYSDLIQRIKWIILFFYRILSPSFIRSNRNSLHRLRLEIILFFSKKNSINLFGSNWFNSQIFPKGVRKYLTNQILILNPTMVENKIQTLKNFKFSFCIENTKEDGYITEKIIDSLVAGTIPVYFGAPDISDYIPSNCFIDFQNFEDLEDLYNYMNNISKQSANKIIQNGFNFLKSPNGELFSYENFSQKILDKVKRCL